MPNISAEHIYFESTEPPSGHGANDLLIRPDDLIIYLFYVKSRVVLLLNGIIYVKQI